MQLSPYFLESPRTILNKGTLPIVLLSICFSRAMRFEFYLLTLEQKQSPTPSFERSHLNPLRNHREQPETHNRTDWCYSHRGKSRKTRLELMMERTRFTGLPRSFLLTNALRHLELFEMLSLAVSPLFELYACLDTSWMSSFWKVKLQYPIPSVLFPLRIHFEERITPFRPCMKRSHQCAYEDFRFSNSWRIELTRKTTIFLPDP